MRKYQPHHDTPNDQGQLFPVIDRWFAGLLAITALATAFLLLLPFAGPLIALATPVRQSRWRMTVLWILASLLSLMTLAPYLLGVLDLQFVRRACDYVNFIQDHVVSGGRRGAARSSRSTVRWRWAA